MIDLPQHSRRRIVLYIALIFFTALGSRLLYWQDMWLDAEKVESSVTAGYRANAKMIAEDGFSSLWSRSSRLSNPNTLKHPPGYAILRSLIFKLGSQTDTAIIFIQILAEAAAAVMVFLIGIEFARPIAALIAGLLVALAPQFSWHAVIALPDSLASLPLLVAIYFLIRAYKDPQLGTIVLSAICIGVSAWLRANALLLAPFICLLFPLLFRRGRRLRYALAFVGTMMVVIAPVTIRNAIVFHHFVPLSLSAGHTLMIGIADYDPTDRFGMPHTDLSLQRMEAQLHKRPDYARSLFDPDGFLRERERLSRGFSVIKSAPLWFGSVMVRRAIWMLRLERVRLVRSEPAVRHSVQQTSDRLPLWTKSSAEMAKEGEVVSNGASATLSGDGTLVFIGNANKYGQQFGLPAVSVRKNMEYVFTVPVKIERGRIIVKVTSVGRNDVRASSIADVTEGVSPEQQPVTTVRLPFVSPVDELVRLEFGNEAASSSPLVHLGAPKLYELGPASFTWTRFPRLVVGNLQRLFKTALMLPLALFGAVLLARSGRRRELAILLGVPFYYFCIQSALHSEYRYVLVIHYFLFILVAIAIWWLFGQLVLLYKTIWSPLKHKLGA